MDYKTDFTSCWFGKSTTDQKTIIIDDAFFWQDAETIISNEVSLVPNRPTSRKFTGS